MDEIQTQTIYCPYCGEGIEVQVDTSAGTQAYIEDCQVCCRPIEVSLFVSGSDWQLQAHRDDD